MLGQITAVDPKHVVEFIIMGGFVLGIWFAFRAANRRKVEIEQPVETKKAPQFITIETWQSSHKSVDDRIKRIESDIASLRAETKVDREAMRKDLLVEVGKVHDRVDLVLEQVAESKGQLTSIAEQLKIILGHFVK